MMELGTGAISVDIADDGQSRKKFCAEGVTSVRNGRSHRKTMLTSRDVTVSLIDGQDAT